MNQVYRNKARAWFMSLLMLVTLLAGTVLTSCEKNDGDSTPVVSYFRVVEKDSTITAGSFGLTVAIIGENLQDVQEVWFNDLKATLNPNYITSGNIICSVPNKLPGEILNEVRLVTGSGITVTTPFTVILPPPVIKALYNEMAAPGSQTKVLGSSFYFVREVRVGASVAEIESFTDTEIMITVPSSAAEGDLITVVTEGGEAVSNFKYKDAGTWLFDFDKPATGWGSIACWGGMKMRQDADSYQGQYGYISGSDLPPADWNNDWVASTCWYDFGYTAESLKDKVLKFEINAKLPWLWNDNLANDKHATLYISINGVSYGFRPQEDLAYRKNGFTTAGWMTVTIPVSKWNLSGGIHDFQLVLKTHGQTYAEFSTYFDNFRFCDVVVADE